MGILNVTPNSFSDGGRFNTLSSALQHAQKMVNEGAKIIDVGGEATNPGSAPISLQEELDRVIPVIEHIKKNIEVLISIDTSQPQVMKEACAHGAGLINDIRALQIPGSLEMAIRLNVPVCLMHMQGIPQNMQINPTYQNVNREVKHFFKTKIDHYLSMGLLPDNIIIDPGFGFGKNLAHNLSLLKNLKKFKKLGYPILVGLSKKKMIGDILDLPVEQRLNGSISLHLYAFNQGAKFFRVHDVKAHVEALRAWQALK
ncbi:MAG: dihydropteroate synthase [Francisellaceae bacterium]|nr:dihydropteroate synthase [Francisellaceae bacterium]